MNVTSEHRFWVIVHSLTRVDLLAYQNRSNNKEFFKLNDGWLKNIYSKLNHFGNQFYNNIILKEIAIFDKIYSTCHLRHKFTQHVTYDINLFNMSITTQITQHVTYDIHLFKMSLFTI